MFEIKRINKLWSNQSLYCKTEVFIPIFSENKESSCENTSFETTPHDKRFSQMQHDKPKKGHSNRKILEDESLDQLLKRIDVSMRKTKSAIRRFDRILMENDKSYDF
jgi:hypothetical protein